MPDTAPSDSVGVIIATEREPATEREQTVHLAMATQATASKGASRMPMPSVRSSASLPFTADEKIEAAVRERMHHGRQTGGEPSGALGAGPSSLSRGSRDKEGERLIKAQEFMRLLRERREVQRKKSVPEIFSSALRTLLRNFALAYNLRFAASFVLRLFNVIRKDGFRRALDLEHLVDEGALKFRADGVRLGLLLGGFTGWSCCVPFGNFTWLWIVGLICRFGLTDRPNAFFVIIASTRCVSPGAGSLGQVSGPLRWRQHVCCWCSRRAVDLVP